MKSKNLIISFALLLTCLFPPRISLSQSHSSLDPYLEELFEKDDSGKSADELLFEASILFQDERLLDARTKLLQALRKDPNNYRIHMMLSSYYIIHVGHFRLALKYVKQGLKLFTEENGPPPYLSNMSIQMHMQFLSLLSQARLSLDDYEGSLKVLDDFEKLQYSADWYYGTRAWVLMKLGRLEEAIEIAKEGVRTKGEPGRTLNMLGILLSMHDERLSALDVFNEAIRYELSLGLSGQPATPLNNSGEVYKEIFQDEKAERSWLRATSLPDGCEHVLPSLNLAFLYLDQLKLSSASRVIDNFESCVAQFPLKNGEEHRALVHLARGKIALLAGNFDDAVKHFEETLMNKQWFGKIGTNPDDLLAAGLASLAQALAARANKNKFYVFNSFTRKLEAYSSAAFDDIHSWWLFRRARAVLTRNLLDFEDLLIRHTDSMLSYPELGEVIATFPDNVATKRLLSEEKRDARAFSSAFYNSYIAEVKFNNGEIREGKSFLSASLNSLRTTEDVHLRAKNLSLLLKYDSLSDAQYSEVATQLYKISKASFRRYGLKLPVRFSGAAENFQSTLSKSLFKPLADSAHSSFSIDSTPSPKGLALNFISSDPRIGGITVSGEDIVDVSNRFIDAVFSDSLR